MDISTIRTPAMAQTNTDLGPLPAGIDPNGFIAMMRKIMAARRAPVAARPAASMLGSGGGGGRVVAPPMRSAPEHAAGRPASAGGLDEMEQVWGTQAGGATSGQAMMPWSPGMGFSIGKEPVFMGNWSKNIHSAIPQNSTATNQGKTAGETLAEAAAGAGGERTSSTSPDGTKTTTSGRVAKTPDEAEHDRWVAENEARNAPYTVSGG